MAFTLVFYCVINYHKPSGLVQIAAIYHHLILQYLPVVLGCRLAGSLVLDLSRYCHLFWTFPSTSLAGIHPNLEVVYLRTLALRDQISLCSGPVSLDSVWLFFFKTNVNIHQASWESSKYYLGAIRWGGIYRGCSSLCAYCLYGPGLCI